MRAVAGGVGGVGVAVDDVGTGDDAAGEIGVRRVDAGVDDGDERAGAARGAGRRGGEVDRVERPLDLGPHGLAGLAPERPRSARLCGSGEVEEVGAFGVVELERAGQCLQDALRDAVDVAAFQAGVVRNADARQDGDLLAA